MTSFWARGVKNGQKNKRGTMGFQLCENNLEQTWREQ
jgi:hypothetical protein